MPFHLGHSDAKAGGAAGAASRILKHKMHPDEAMKILNIEKPIDLKVLEKVMKSQSFDSYML